MSSLLQSLIQAKFIDLILKLSTQIFSPLGQIQHKFRISYRFQSQNRQSAEWMKGMKVEAWDRKTPSLVCVATIGKDTNAKSFKKLTPWLVHFLTCSVVRSFICACMCAVFRSFLHLFVHSFIQKKQCNWFRKYVMLLLSVLKQRPMVKNLTTCFCTLADVDDETGDLVVHFDGWTSRYDYHCDPTSVDIHPIGWFQHYIENESVRSKKKNSDGKVTKYSMELQKPKGNFNV